MKWLLRMLGRQRPDHGLAPITSTAPILRATALHHEEVMQRADRLVGLVEDYRRKDTVMRRGLRPRQ